MMRAARLGDDIDDFCVKCKRIMNHAVVSILNDQPAKVRCRTCYSDHDYRHEMAPPPKVDSRKAALFNQVLESVTVGVVPADAAASPVDPMVDPHVDEDASLNETVAAGDAAAVPAEVAKAPAKGRKKSRA